MSVTAFAVFRFQQNRKRACVACWFVLCMVDCCCVKFERKENVEQTFGRLPAVSRDLWTCKGCGVFSS